jgi:type IV secretory pathway protease TraF
MNAKQIYSSSAAVIATIAWLLLAALFGGLVVSEHLFEIALPLGLYWVSVTLAIISLAIATVVPPQTRCRLTVWFPLF